MNDFGVSDLPPGLESLARALCAWVRQGNSASLERWFARELGDDGAPIRLSIPDWRQCVRGLAEAKHCRPGWSKRVDRQALALLRSLLRFSRPAGTPTTDFDAVELDASYRTSLAQLARAYAQWRGAGDRLVALAARRLARSAPASRLVELPACAGGSAWGLAKT